MKDYLRRYRFRVFIGGVAGAGFHSCTGLSASSKFTTIREAGALSPIHLFDEHQFKPIVLSRGLTRTDNDAYFWWETSNYMHTPANLLNKRNIKIEVHSNHGGNLKNRFEIPEAPPATYIVYGASVQEVQFGDLIAQDNEFVVVQNLVLIHRGIQRVQTWGGLV